MERLVTHGQQLKVISQLNLKCVAMRQFYPDHDFIIDSHTLKKKDDTVGEDEEEGYEGATVVEPKTGYYEDQAVIVMDFSSLYPSIMIGNNLCKSTIVKRPEDFEKPGVVKYTVSEGSVHYFSSKNKGIIPAMLEETLARRKIAKKEKEKAEARKDHVLKRLKQLEEDGQDTSESVKELNMLKSLILAFDKRQLALKVSANSAYGFLGAEKTGKFADKAVAATVTLCGRNMLMESCAKSEEVSKTLTKHSDGQPVGDFTLVYGDTDSLMVTLSNVKSPEDGHHAGVAMSSAVTKMFHARGEYSKKLEQEKVFQPWILFKKKRYCGIKYEENHEGNIVSRGVTHSGTANKRRDSCLFVGKIYNAMVEPLLYESDRVKSIEAFHQNMDAFMKREVAWDDLVITKSLQSSYKNENLAQCQVVAKQRAREPGSEAKPGSRLKLVYIEGKKGSKINELAEDADYAREQGLKIDQQVYIKSQISTPVLSLLELISSNAQKLMDDYAAQAMRIRDGTPSITSFLKCDPVKTNCKIENNAQKEDKPMEINKAKKQKTFGSIDKFLKKK